MRYIALLRAVNVGGRIVKMDRLRALCEDLGLRNVTTYIASGNVLFESTSTNSATLEKRLEDALQKALGYDVAVFVRSAAELVRTARAKPFDALKESSGQSTTYVGFLKKTLDKKARAVVMSYRSDVDDFAVRGREIYWRCRVKSMDSAFSATRLERTLRTAATFRNLTTVLKLAELCAESD